MESRRFVGSVEIKPGAVITHNPNMELRFTARARCESVDPDVWIGEVVLDGRVVLQTEPVSDYGVAGQQAERLLVDRMIALLGEDE